MIPELGLFCLVQSLLLSSITVILLCVGLCIPKYHFLQRGALYLTCGQGLFVFLSFFTLMISFATNDFSVLYVAQNSNSQLPFVYRLCALWGAHEGSLLLWVLVLSLWMLAFTFISRKLATKFRACVTAILSAIQVGFLVIILQTSNPFLRLLPFSPEQGADLNPLLQDPGFILHPPFLYLGYVGFAIPFSLALASMILNQDKNEWAVIARPWCLLAWSFLTVGITLGSWWAYYELGWGGWWFWDPVENASFMPWLIGAALTHALYTSKNKSFYAPWTLLLALSAFILSLIGTFLVRSGVLSSVHAFASDPKRGSYILSFLTGIFVISFALYFYRSHQDKRIHLIGVLSKDALLLFGNIVFFVATLTVLLGTLYPLGYEVFYHEKLSVGPPYFNTVFIPIMIPVLAMMAVAPHVQWHNDSLKKIWRKIRMVIFALIAIFLLLVIVIRIPWLSAIGVLLGLGVIFSAIAKIFSSEGLSLRKIGMVLAHSGVGISLLGISLTPALQVEKEFKMAVGESAIVGNYAFELKHVKDIQGANFEGKKAHFIIKNIKNKKIMTTLFPEKRFYSVRGVPTTETAISAGLLRDIYIALGERFETDEWSVRFYIKPYVRWIWLGGLLIALGAFLSSIFSFKRCASEVSE